jgi:hypothetical protein
MNHAIAKAAAAFAGAAALWLLWSGSRRRIHHAEKRDVRAQLKTWEGEGGQLAAAPGTTPPAPH